MPITGYKWSGSDWHISTVNCNSSTSSTTYVVSGETTKNSYTESTYSDWYRLIDNFSEYSFSEYSLKEIKKPVFIQEEFDV